MPLRSASTAICEGALNRRNTQKYFHGHSALLCVFPRLKYSICIISASLLAGCSTIPERELENAFTYQRLKRSNSETTKPIKWEYHTLASKAWKTMEAGGTAEYVSILELGDDALLARIHLIRSPRKSVDIQTFIWKDDPTSRIVFD